MSQNAEDLNKILNEINTKIDYMATHNDKQSIDALLNQVKALEKSFNDGMMNFDFEKQNIFETIQKEITGIIEKSAILKDLFPQEDNSKFDRVENTLTSNLSRVHNDLSDTIKQDFNQVAQGIGALYARIENLKSSVESNKNLDSIRDDINILGNKMTEIRNELQQNSSNNLGAIIENINKNDNNINTLKSNLDNSFTNIDKNFQYTNDNISKFNTNFTNIIENINKNDANLTDIKSNLDSNFVDINKNIQVTNDNLSQFNVNLTNIAENINKNETNFANLKNDLNISFVDVQKNIQNTNENISELNTNLVNIAEDINSKNNTNLTDLKLNLSSNFADVNKNVQNTNDNITDFKENLAANLTNYLTSIKDLFASFSQEMQAHHENLTSDIFNKKLQELDILSKDIDTLSNTINFNEESYKVFLNTKIQELYNYLKTLEDILSSSNIYVGNSVTEITNVKKSVETTTIKLDEIYSKLITELGLESKKIDDLKDFVSNNIATVNSKLYTMEDNIVKGINNNISTIEQLKTDIGSSVDTNFNEIKSILEYMGASLSKGSGETFSVSKTQTNIENILYKITEMSDNNLLTSDSLKQIIENKITEIQNYLNNLEKLVSDSSLNLNNSLSEITDIKEYIANTSLKLDDIGANFAENISKSSENIADVKNILTLRLDSITSKLFTMEDNLAKEISGKITEIEQAKDSAAASVNNNINELKTILECLRANIAQSSSNLSTKISEIETSFNERLNEISQLNNEQKVYTDEIKSELKNISDDIQKTQAQIANIDIPKPDTYLSLNLAEVKSSVGALTQSSISLSDKINDIGTSFDEKIENFSNEQNENSVELKNILNNVSEEISKTQEQIANIDIPKPDTYLSLGLAEVQSSVSALTQSSISLSDKINDIGTSFDEKVENISNVQNENSAELKTILNNVSEEISKTQNQISEIEIPKPDENIPIEIANIKSALYELNNNSINFSERINELGSAFASKLDDLSSQDAEQKNNATEIKTLLNYISDEIEKTQGDVSNSVIHIAKNREDIFERIEDIKNHISAIKLAMADLNTEASDKLTEKLFIIESKLYESSDIYEQNLTQLQTKLGEYISNVELISEETNSKLLDSASELVDIKTNLNEIQDKITYLNTDQKSFLEENIESIINKIDTLASDLADNKEDIKSDLKEVVKENIVFVDKGLEYLTMTLNEIKGEQSENYEGINNIITNKLADIKQEIELLNTDISDIYQSKTENIIKEFEPLKSAILDFTSFDFNEIITELKNQIEVSYLNLLQELNKNLIENHDTYVHIENTYKDVVSRCSSLQECIDDFSKNNLELINSTIAGLDLNVRSYLEKGDKFLTEWQTYAANLDKKLSENNKELEHSLLNILEELQKTIDEKVKAGSSELKDFLAVMLNNEDLTITLENLNVDIANQIEEFKSGIETKNEKLQSSISNIEKNVNSKLTEIQLDITANRPDEDEQLNKFANLIKVALQDLQQTVEAKFNDTDSSSNFAKLADSLKELHSKVDIIALNDDSDIKDEISEISEKINKNSENSTKISEMLEGLHSKVDILALNDDSEMKEDIFEISEKLDKTSETDKKISEMLEALHSKIDVLAMTDDSDLRDEITDVKDLIYEQRKFFESIDKDKKAEEIDKYLQNLQQEINKIDLEKNTQDIKDAIMSSILTVSDQITFVEETEEIKDFVEAKTNVINETLQDVKKQLKKIASSNSDSDMDLYSYTLQDVESDIAKLRLTLNEISSSNTADEVGVISSNINRIAKSIEDLRSTFTTEQNDETKGGLGKLNEDILSISARTNKLLLNSDESYRIICDSMDEFNRKTDYLQEQLDIINSKNLEAQLVNIDKKVNATMSSSKVLENVMMYLGEWMDGTTDIVNSIYDKTAKTATLQNALDELKANLPEKQELLKTIEDKFEEQQSRIDRLEKKLEKAITMLEEREADTVQNKIDNIETQLAKLSSNIEKLTSYVDE